jgi:hypothetical protein
MDTGSSKENATKRKLERTHEFKTKKDLRKCFVVWL